MYCMQYTYFVYSLLFTKLLLRCPLYILQHLRAFRQWTPSCRGTAFSSMAVPIVFNSLQLSTTVLVHGMIEVCSVCVGVSVCTKLLQIRIGVQLGTVQQSMQLPQHFYNSISTGKQGSLQRNGWWSCNGWEMLGEILSAGGSHLAISTSDCDTLQHCVHVVLVGQWSDAKELCTEKRQEQNAKNKKTAAWKTCKCKKKGYIANLFCGICLLVWTQPTFCPPCVCPTSWASQFIKWPRYISPHNMVKTQQEFCNVWSWPLADNLHSHDRYKESAPVLMWYQDSLGHLGRMLSQMILTELQTADSLAGWDCSTNRTTYTSHYINDFITYRQTYM